jgi:hypothetical protein
LYSAAITSKKGQALHKRDVTLLDKTGSTVKLTIWVSWEN